LSRSSRPPITIASNGNRIDLMEKLAAMHPKFLRFPGGNYLEGDHIAERFEWKKTIGPLVDRPTHPSPWMLPLLRRHGAARIPRVVRRL
jgi:alpha-L-arabinofuranosidase